jgi:hypothetical protein
MYVYRMIQLEVYHRVDAEMTHTVKKNKRIDVMGE